MCVRNILLVCLCFLKKKKKKGKRLWQLLWRIQICKLEYHMRKAEDANPAVISPPTMGLLFNLRALKSLPLCLRLCRRNITPPGMVLFHRCNQLWRPQCEQRIENSHSLIVAHPSVPRRAVPLWMRGLRAGKGQRGRRRMNQRDSEKYTGRRNSLEHDKEWD